MRQPTAPFSFSFLHNATKRFGVVAEYIVFSTVPLQCLHRNAQEEPVIEIDGKEDADEQKWSVL
jgi:hypothetical protein